MQAVALKLEAPSASGGKVYILCMLYSTSSKVHEVVVLWGRKYGSGSLQRLNHSFETRSESATWLKSQLKSKLSRGYEPVSDIHALSIEDEMLQYMEGRGSSYITESKVYSVLDSSRSVPFDAGIDAMLEDGEGVPDIFMEAWDNVDF